MRKISLIVVILEPFHGAVDDPECVFGSLLGKVKVDHGGLQSAVAHISLNHCGVDASLQQMSGIAMAQSMNGDSPFGNARSVFGLSEGSLDAVNGHRLPGGCRLIAPSSQSGKNERGVLVGYPVAAEQLIGVLRKRNIAVFCSFATMDMNHLPLAIDVGNFKGECFRDP